MASVESARGDSERGLRTSFRHGMSRVSILDIENWVNRRGIDATAGN